ncbi:MAG: hypothetical protein V4574_12315 [Pseudomonadota bacterium]
MTRAIKRLLPAAALALLLCPLAAHAQKRSCITDAELEAVIAPQIRAGARLIDTSSLDYRRYLCTGGSIAARIHRMREDYHPDERAEREDREARVRADIARIAIADQAARDRRDDAERLEALARIANARRAAADAEAGTREAELRAARAERALAALPPLQRATATILYGDSPELDTRLEQVVLQDAEYWLVNRYEPRSMHDSSLLSVSRPGSDFEALGYFRYAGGGTGWVSIRFHRGQPVCLEYHNQSGNCRALGNSLSRQNVTAVALDLLWGFAAKKLGF